MQQLEAKIDTGRHNLKIKMDKELYRLQKEIGLHVNDIKRIQGLMSRLAIMHGRTNDEIKRNKTRARETMKLLGDTKKVQSAQKEGSPDRKSSATGGTTHASGSEDDNPINMLLFGNKMAGSRSMMSGMMSQSLGGTMNSNSNYMTVIMPLKHMLKHCEFTQFNIASQN